VTDTALLVIVDHLKILSADFKKRFSDLKQIDFPIWMLQPMLELAEIQNDEPVKILL